MAFAKMKKTVLLTGDGKMLFRAEEVGGGIRVYPGKLSQLD